MTTFSSKKVLLTVAGVAVLAFGGLLAYALAPTETRNIGAGAVPANAATLVAAGRYVATASDCIACHTAPGGKPFAGGLAMATPIGTLYSSNITPDKATGIGSYSLNDFDRALRHGITPSGGSLYPAMPFPSYARMSDQDVRALYAYFMQEVAPVAASNRASDIAWPLSIRWPLGIWRKTFGPAESSGEPVPRPYADQAIARGAYLVQSLGHCGSCHTPRAATLQEVGLDESHAGYLAGGPIIDGWLAGSLRGNPADGLGNWSVQDIVDTLRTGRNGHSGVIGSPMSDVVKHSTQFMTEADLQAIALYLKTLPASPGANASQIAFQASETTANALHAGQEGGRGGQLYLDNCAACHRTDGKSNGKVFPALPGNQTVLAGDPTSLIRLVLAGSALPSTEKAPSNLGMPGFAWRLSDEETAQVVTFIRQSWGNQAPAATASEVAKVRKLVADEKPQTAQTGH